MYFVWVSLGSVVQTPLVAWAGRSWVFLVWVLGALLLHGVWIASGTSVSGLDPRADGENCL